MPEPSPNPYDAVLLLSFGGPESREDVMPFLEIVLRGRPVPRERMLEVAEHYYHFDGKSPINDQNRALLAELRNLFESEGPKLPVYWGNRNWHPFLADTLRQMRDDGVRRAVAFATSAYSSYSGCRQYLEDIQRARAEVGEGAPQIDKLPSFYNHPGFIQASADRTRQALERIPEDRRSAAHLIFTAHSIPLSMAATSDYERQVEEASRLVAESVGRRGEYRIAWQSRSGSPAHPWLEPDILHVLRELEDSRDVVIMPIGFVSDHMEVVYDLDTEAAALARELGLNLVRASTVGTHPRYVRMIRELVLDKVELESGHSGALQAIGETGRRGTCPLNCCPPPVRPRGA